MSDLRAFCWEGGLLWWWELAGGDVDPDLCVYSRPGVSCLDGNIDIERR